MKPIVADPDLVACCGLYCGACRSYLVGRCPGCRANDRARWCKVRTCCIGHGCSTCAACAEFADPMVCGKFNNFISKVFAFVFRSDRAACIEQIRRVGLQGHAEDMAAKRRQSIKR